MAKNSIISFIILMVFFGHLGITTAQSSYEWTFSVEVESGAFSQNMKFGARVGATDGFDIDFDAPSPPPLPGSSKNAYFSISNPIFNTLFQDNRNVLDQSNPSEKWELKVQSDEEVTIAWDSSSIPDQVKNMKLIDGTDIMEMKAASRYSLPSGSRTVYIQAEFNSEFVPTKENDSPMVSLENQPNVGTTNEEEFETGEENSNETEVMVIDKIESSEAQIGESTPREDSETIGNKDSNSQKIEESKSGIQDIDASQNEEIMAPAKNEKPKICGPTALLILTSLPLLFRYFKFLKY